MALGGLSLSLTGCRKAGDSAAEAIRSGEPPRVLTGDEVRTLEAFSDRILPPVGDAPGAAALGAVVFMDHYAAQRPDVLEGLRDALSTLGARLSDAHPGVASFAELDADAADAVVRRLEEQESDTFLSLHQLVVFGAFAAPAQGGNRDRAGWALMEYDDRMAWQPPFGYYDAEATRGGDQ
jgi:Gluconate 2-dehydrogenase subunit 3